MNLTTSLLALAGQNLSSTLQAPGGYVFCSEFYGSYYKRKDCIKAINLLEKGTTEIPYAVQGDIGPHALPLSKSYGECMVQIEVAGPRLPQTFNASPNSIRKIANTVLDSCLTGRSNIGGFATSNLQAMESWITAEGIKLDRPFPTSTAFLTVSLNQRVPDWLSPGNYDPIMAYQFSNVEVAAIDRATTRRAKLDLRNRADRLLRQAERMQPRGTRVPWWDNPGPIANGISLEVGNGTVSVDRPEPLASGAGTATLKRRRRT